MSARVQTIPPVAHPETESRILRLEAEVASLRREIGESIAAQEQLNAQLRVAIEKLAEVSRQRAAAPVIAAPRVNPDPSQNHGQQIGRLESRVRSLEQRVERVAGQVTGILDSRIWKTLVRAGSFFLRFKR